MRIAKRRPLSSASPTRFGAEMAACLGAVTSNESGKYQALFEQASDAILLVDREGKIEDLNRAAEELTGFMKSELVGHSLAKLRPHPGQAMSLKRARPMGQELLGTPGTVEDVVLQRKDGYPRWVEASVRPIQAQPDGISVLLLLRDVSEKKRLERELLTKHSELLNAYLQLEKKSAEMQALQETLVQAGKMTALGELATGIAHELNQPLQVIRGFAQELEALPLADAATRASYLKEIITGVDKMRSIIDYLRGHVRKSGEGQGWVDVNQVLDESFKMLERQLRARGIELIRNYQPNLPQVFANPVQLEQVFINLGTNARDAIEATGRGTGRIEVETQELNGFVEVRFRDDGCGMPEKTRQKAFNPFFTTKEVGKGMGLGLSLSYGIITRLQGSILVESELGKGACFTVRLPRDYREL